MSTIVTRTGKGTPLTNVELDANFTNLNTDKYQSGASPSFTNVAITGTITGSTGVLNIGSGQLYKDASGNVGIGTSSPSFPFETKKTGTDSTIWGYNVAQFADATANNTGLRIATSTTTSGLTQLVAATASVASQFGFWTYNGSAWGERMRIDSSGNVGIGVTPSAWSSLKAIQLFNGVSLASYTGGAQPISYLTSGAIYDGAWKYSVSSSPIGGYNINQGVHQWFTAPSGTSGNTVTFTQAMTLDASGNLGIGTTSPVSGSKLTISTATSTASQFAINNTSYAAGQVMGIDFDVAGGSRQAFIQAVVNNGTSAATDLLFGTAAGGNNATERMRIDSSGNVGIGTSSPLGRLQINSGAADCSIRLRTTASGDGVGDGADFTLSTGNLLYITNRESAGIVFENNGAERMRINSSGNVGIGTSSPSTLLDVRGVGSFGNGTITNTVGQDGTNAYLGTATNYPLAFYTNGAIRLRIDTSGNLGLGVTPSAWNASGYKALEMSSAGNALYFGNGDSIFTCNSYYNSAWKYGQTGVTAGFYQINGNTHVWKIAPSGTAGNAVTFTQAMTLDASGNLLVGTTSQIRSGLGVFAGSGSSVNQIVLADTRAYNATPAAQQTFSTKYNAAGAYADTAYIRGGKSNATDGNTLGYLSFATNTGAASVEAMRIDSSGNVGIGTSSPASKLEVVGNSGVLSIKSANDSGSNYIAFKNTSGTTLWDTGIGNTIRQDEYVIRRAGTPVMYMSNANNVSIGTTASLARLSVSSATAKATASTLNISSFSSGDSIGATDLLLGIRQGGSATQSLRWTGIQSYENSFGVQTLVLQDLGGNVLIGKTTNTANGGDLQVSSGITFPATQVAKTDANTLDDYEEGTWTVTAYGASTAGTTTYTSQTGYYTKIGKQVTASFYLTVTSMTGTGWLLIGGLPFTGVDGYQVGSCMTNNLDYPNAGSPVVYLGPSRTYMELYISSDNAAWISCNTDGAFEVIASITYRTA